MKDILKGFTLILFLTFITISKEDLCPDYKISIKALGTSCETIDDILENPELFLDNDNLLYLASIDNGKIEKNNYTLEIFKLNDDKLQSQNIKKSNLYIPKTCIEAMELDEKIKLNTEKGIVILAYNYNKMNKHNLPDTFFVIRHDSDNSEIKFMNSKNFDFSLCHDEPILLDQQINIDTLRYDISNDTSIDIEKILYAKKFKVDLFDPHSPFLTDICFKFTSEHNTDVTLDSRLEDYYQNIILCNESLRAHYMGYNYSIPNKQLTYRCSYGFYENEEQKDSYVENINEINDKMENILSTSSNLKVITCFRQLFDIKNLVHNYGGILCFSVLLIQIILYIDYCCRGAKPLQNQILSMFEKAEKKEAENKKLEKEEKEEKENNNNEGNTDDRLDNNNNEVTTGDNGFIKIEEIKYNDSPLQNEQEENKDEKVVRKKKGKRKTTKKGTKKALANPKKKSKTIKPTYNVEKKTDELENDDLNKDKARKNKKVITTIPETNEKKKKKVTTKDLDIKSEKRIYEFNDEEKNNLPFERALKHDKRTFCQYYGFMLQVSHIIVNVFCRCGDYNLFTIKLGLLFMLFPINITFASFFFTNENIKYHYVQKLDEVSLLIENLVHTFIASICSSVILILLKMLCLTHNSILKLRKIKSVEKARKSSEWTIRCIKIRIFVYYLLSFIFLLVFGYFVACFCTIFENTQRDLIKSMFTSWGLSLIYPFIICFVTTIFRISALRCKKKCLYRVNQLLQMI